MLALVLPALASSSAGAAEAPEVSQRPARWEVGLGIVQGRSSEFDSLTLIGRYNVGAGLAMELSGMGRNPAADPTNNLDRTLLDIAYQGDPNTNSVVPVNALAGQLALRADWGFVPRAAAGKFTGGPRLLAGFALRGTDHYVASVSEAYRSGDSTDPAALSDPEFQLHPSFEGGLALDAWYSGRVGLSARWLGSAWEDLEPDYIGGDIDPTTGEEQQFETQVYLEARVSLVVLVAF